MADTVRSEAEILTLFADNNSGAISPQDLRDFVVSIYDEPAAKTFDGISNPGGNIDLIAGGAIVITPNLIAKTITIATSSLSGEANTASNVGIGGVGVFKQKTLVDLEFRNINAASNKVSIALDSGNNEVDINVVEANIIHQNLSGAGSNTHAQIDTHIANSSNPHGVTATQIGALVSVDGVSNSGGNIDLIAGTGIAITPDDTLNTITVASTVTAAQVGALVSVDGVSNSGGNIDLIAGAGITITPDDTLNTITVASTVTATTPGGLDTQIQYNNTGAFGGDSGFTTNGAGAVNIVGDLDVDNLNFNGNTISSTNSNGAIIITPDGSGAIQVDAGGNARGVDAIDFQSTRSVATEVASGARSFIAGGQRNTVTGNDSHAEGYSTIADGNNSHVEGNNTQTIGSNSHAECYNSIATGNHSHAEGRATNSLGDSSHAEGFSTISGGYNSHAEGDTTSASGYAAHSEGSNTTASGPQSHAEGDSTTASGYASHAEGDSTTASSNNSHSGGAYSIARFNSCISRASGRFDSNSDAQTTEVILFGETTNATLTELFISNVSNTRLSLDINRTWFFEINIVARRTDTGNDSAGYRVEGVIKKDDLSASTALIGVPTKVSYEDVIGWDVSVNADTTNGALRVQVTGAGGATIRWVARAKLTEVQLFEDS